MILFTQSTAVLHKYLNDELKILFCLLQFFPEVAQFPEFSMFRELPEYSRFSRFVATLSIAKVCAERFAVQNPFKNKNCSPVAY